MGDFTVNPDLEAYRFYEQEWGSYEQLFETFEWEVPDKFNFATYACTRWAPDKQRIALFGGGTGESDRTYTYWQLERVTNRLANYFQDQGIERGDRIGITMPQKPETAMLHLAAWKMGAVSVPASTLYGPDALKYRFSDAGVRGVVVDEECLDSVREIKRELDLEMVLTVGDINLEDNETDFWTAQECHSPEFENVATNADDNLIIIYTSGTTGDPKGTVHAHRVMLGHLPSYISSHLDFDVRGDDVVWTPVEWSWTGTILATMGPALYLGLPVVAHYTPGSFDPETAFEAVERYGVTATFIPATALKMMMQVDDPTDNYDLNSMRIIGSGGEALGEEVSNWADRTFEGATVHELFGQTEASGLVEEITEMFPRRKGSIGKPTPGHDVRILDPETAEANVSIGEVGEIGVWYEGDPVCMKEYWKKPELTAEKIKNGWLRTGDLGRRDEDEYFYFEGRKDDVITSSGYRIGPDEVEESMIGHEAVLDAGVIGVPDEERGNIVKAFVELANGFEPSEGLRQDIQEHVKERSAKYAYPRELEFIDKLPRTVTGKIRRVDLREQEGIE